MNQANKRKKAAQLFLTIGEIDDAVLQEAMLYRPRRRSSTLSRVLMLAATLSACAVVLVAGVIVAMRANDKGEFKPPVDDPAINVPTVEDNNSVVQAAYALDNLLMSKSGGGMDATMKPDIAISTTPEALPFFSGNAHLIWEKDGVYYISRALTSREIATLTDELGKGERVGEESPTLSCRVWILLPDGTVLSPYLESSSGNTASGQLFDYQAELIPSDALISCISGILN